MLSNDDVSGAERFSFRSSTDDLLLPRASGKANFEGNIEHSHWQSLPLGLALLPAVAGLIFKDGGALVTDITLLGLAAVLLNWAVRLPWYEHSLPRSLLSTKHVLTGNGMIPPD